MQVVQTAARSIDPAAKRVETDAGPIEFGSSRIRHWLDREWAPTVV